MERSEAQKAADKRYAKKIYGKYKPFVVHLMPEEWERINTVIAASGMSKADFLRWAVKESEKQNSK